MVATVPGFSRVEIRTRDKADLIAAAPELKKLADELKVIGRSEDLTDEQAIILAHHKIKATSQKLRRTSDAD